MIPIKARLRLHRLRTRVFLFSFLSTLALGTVSLYNQLNSQMYLAGMSSILERSRPYVALKNNAVNLGRILETYLSTKNYSDLKHYWSQSQDIYTIVWGLDLSLHDDQAMLLRADVVQLVKVYLRATEDAISAKRGRDVASYTAAFSRADRVLHLIVQAASELILFDYQESSYQGEHFASQIAALQLCNTLMLLSLITLGLLLGFWFSGHLTGPLTRLSESAREMSRGNYMAEIAPYSRNDEIGLLTNGIISLRSSIIRNIDELTTKAEIETGLMNERLANLHMKNLLKNAELQALQSQVNPHFLFNTLNTGIQLAIIDDADRTRLYIEHLADVFRHNIRRLDKPIGLVQELSSLQSYFYVMKIRFADRFELQITTPPHHANPLMPAMILQPLVENAITHGLRDREEGGKIEVIVAEKADFLIVTVADNGCGMAVPQVQKFMEIQDDEIQEGDNSLEPDDSSKSNGIGLRNVASRMRLYFGDDEIMTIVSVLGEGTRISFRVPKNKEHGNV